MSQNQPERKKNATSDSMSTSSSGAAASLDAQSRRVSNACQGCKRRKAKVLGFSCDYIVDQSHANLHYSVPVNQLPANDVVS